jgi:hypothetical protein
MPASTRVPYCPGVVPTSTNARSLRGRVPVLLTSCAVTAIAGRSTPSAAGTKDRCRPDTTTPARPALPPPAAKAASASWNWAYA